MPVTASDPSAAATDTTVPAPSMPRSPARTNANAATDPAGHAPAAATGIVPISSHAPRSTTETTWCMAKADGVPRRRNVSAPFAGTLLLAAQVATKSETSRPPAVADTASRTAVAGSAPSARKHPSAGAPNAAAS